MRYMWMEWVFIMPTKYENSNIYFVIASFTLSFGMGLFTNNIPFSILFSMGFVCIGLGIREVLLDDQP